MWNIKNREKLLQNVSDQFKEENFYHSRMGTIEIILFENNQEVVRLSLEDFLDFIVNDLFWNEYSNWSNADKAIVQTF